MPFYEYECPHCGYHDEVLQTITDAPLKKCPNCGKKGLRKLMSAPVFRLKGSGWYETDFKSDKENKRNLHGAEQEEAKPADTVDAKADTKADAKADAAKGDTAKPEATKAESKPAAEKPGPVKRAAARTKTKHKGARTARRLTRR
jgi:putative FmdB family regulatory protein